MEVKFAKSFNEKVERLIKDERSVEKLYSTLQTFQEEPDVANLVKVLREVINEPKRLPLFNDIRPLIPTKYQIQYDRLAPKISPDKMRIVRLSRTPDHADNLGFSVRGGVEHAVGLYVSDVETDSVADDQGLKPGDEIVRLNGFSVSQAVHQEALNLIKARSELILKVRNVGMIPVRDNPWDNVTWKYVDVEPGSGDLLSVNSTSEGSSVVGEEINLFVNIPLGAGLGCSICSGPRERPGIFVQSVRLGGIAREAGLEVGDQILRVNDTKFENISHSEAIVAFKSSRHLNLVIKKGVGAHLFSGHEDNHSVALNDIPSEGDTDTRTQENFQKRKTKHEDKRDNGKTFRHKSPHRNQAEDDLSQASATRTPDRKRRTSRKLWIFDQDNMLGGVKDSHRRKTAIHRESRNGDNGEPPPRPPRDRSRKSNAGETMSSRHIDTEDEGETEALYDTIPNDDFGDSFDQSGDDDTVQEPPQVEKAIQIDPSEAPDATTDVYPVLPPPPGPFEEDSDDVYDSTGFDLPAHRLSPFPEAVTDFRGSPTYDTSIPVSQPKLLNPKIYKPIEIQSFKDQTALRPNMVIPRIIVMPSGGGSAFIPTSLENMTASGALKLSPTFKLDHVEEHSNYGIKKPVLLNPGQQGQRSSSQETFPQSTKEQEPVETSKKPSSEQSGDRQLEHITIHKEGVADLGVLLESKENQVIVAEVYEGGAIHRNGGVHVGDQLVMVEQESLLGMTIQQVFSILKQEYTSSKPVMKLVISKASTTKQTEQILPRPDYFDLPVSNLDDFINEDDVEICMYNNDVPVTII